MGKKGKARQDKFYHLAKETGYRSRASFKLLQLNRKFEFLEKSRVVVDLCAAPGSWMQVAKQHMPVSSLIIGIDLFPIKPIQGCIALQEDITTEKCHQNLKKELAGWKADVFLHDGAPNVGQNWLYDAFIQNQLVLSALKLATEFLVKGGWFVTKIFRSKDYQSLMWVLQQLFKRVHSTKPHASRMESAEIFVICQGYKAPDKLDPKFLDPKYVFQELDTENATVKGLKVVEKSKPKAAGYEDGVSVLDKKALVSDFVYKEDYVHILNTVTSITMDDPTIANHRLTTEEIKECCKDIKVLGRKDLKNLLAWRKAVKEDIEKTSLENTEEKDEEEKQAVEEDGQVSDEDDELARIDQQIKELEDEKHAEAKRKRKKLLKERRNLQEKMKLKMVIPGDSGPSQIENKNLFSLDQIKSVQDLNQLADEEAGDLAEEAPEKSEPRPKKAKYAKEDDRLDSSGRFYRQEDDSDEELVFNSDDEYDSDVAQDALGLNVESDDSDAADGRKSKKVRFSDAIKAASEAVKVDDRQHPLLTDLDDDDMEAKKKKKADKWFMKGALANLEDEEDEDLELDFMARRHPIKKKKKSNFEQEITSDGESDDAEDDESDDDSDKDSDESEDEDDDTSEDDNSDYDVNEHFNKKTANGKAAKEVPAPGGDKVRGKKKSLTPEALALGSMLIRSQKSRRDIYDDGWNRYAFNDDGLPDWFVEDERRHNRKELPITKEVVQEYRERMKEINVRPIKKVVEAKARKKRRTLRRMEKMKKKAEAISENMGMSDFDKAQQIRQLHKRALQEKKREVTYVVAKKSQATKRPSRPAGVSGKYKMVDKRMKKDDKTRKAAERRKGGRKRNSKKK